MKRKEHFHPLGIIGFLSLSLAVSAICTPADAFDHALVIEEYTGPSQCESCHQGKTAEMHGSTHYKFESELPEGYLFNEDGTVVYTA